VLTLASRQIMEGLWGATGSERAFKGPVMLTVLTVCGLPTTNDSSWDVQHSPRGRVTYIGPTRTRTTTELGKCTHQSC